MYNTAVGRAVLKIVASRWVSRVVGAYMSSPLSKGIISGFVKKNGIDLDDYIDEKYGCFNDFFTRRIKPERRPVDRSKDAFIAPCDGKLSVYNLSGDTVLPVKQSVYTLSSLLCDDALCERYRDGVCLVFRLCVDNYHRYCYLDDADKEENVFIPGKLHTVRPIALERYPVFTENCREYTLMHTDNFGDVVQIEVGAMLVGKIKNHDGKTRVRRADEKGMFLYGGSTIMVLVQKDVLDIDRRFFEATEQNKEIDVKMGEKLFNKKAISQAEQRI